MKDIGVASLVLSIGNNGFTAPSGELDRVKRRALQVTQSVNSPRYLLSISQEMKLIKETKEIQNE
jgi:hypothetical protein